MAQRAKLSAAAYIFLKIFNLHIIARVLPKMKRPTIELSYCLNRMIKLENLTESDDFHTQKTKARLVG